MTQNEIQPAGAGSKKRKLFNLFGSEFELEIDETMSTDPSEEEDYDDVEKALIRLANLDCSRMVDGSSVREDLSFFLAKVDTGDFELSKRHVNFLTSRSVADAFCNLYLSSLKTNQKLGLCLIKRFIKAVERFSPGLRVYGVPSVIRLCTFLSQRDPREELYYSCREVLRFLLDALIGDSSALEVQRVVVWQQIFPFAMEIGSKVLAEITAGLDSSSEVIVEFNGGSEFSSFVSAVLYFIMKSEDIRMSNGALRHPLCEKLLSLNGLFYQLLNKMSFCLIRVNQHLDVEDDGERIFDGAFSEYLDLLKALSDISRIFKGAGEMFRMMLEFRITAFRILVTEYAIKDVIDLENEKNDWIFEHKEVLSFKDRWDLAVMKFPELLDDEDVGDQEILVDRSKLYADSCEQITLADSEIFQDGLSVQFKNEPATGPGVLREWFLLVCKEIFNPQNALFTPTPNDHRKFYINPASSVQPRHLDHFRFCGRVIALALLHQVRVGIAFDRVLFKQLSSLDIQLEDIKDTDPTLYQSCKKIMEMEAEFVDSDALGLTFSVEIEEFGSRRIVNFHPDGENRKLNSQNREEYVQSVLHHRFCVPTLNQVAHFSKGLSDIFDDSNSFFRCLTVEDLNRVLLGNENDISVEEWQAHTDCSGYDETSREIIWFWKILKKLSPQQRRFLLLFWTTIKYLPFEGFSGLPRRLQICKLAGTPDHLPTSNTCFYQLCIPRYPTYMIMKERISVIVQEHVASSFGQT